MAFPQMLSNLLISTLANKSKDQIVKRSRGVVSLGFMYNSSLKKVKLIINNAMNASF